MKKHLNKIILLSLTLSLFLSISVMDVMAVNADSEIKLMYTGVMSIRIDISISSAGYSNPNTSVWVCSGYSADVTLQLCYDSDKVEYTWTTSGTGMLSLNKGRYVVPGHEYYARVHVIVYDSHDNIVDDITLKSDVASY